MGAKSSNRHGRFLSLKWKAVLVFSLVLLIVNASLATLGYLQLERQFAQHREQVTQRQRSELQALIDDGFSYMQQFASLIPLLESAHFRSPDFSIRLESAFEQHASILELELGVETAGFYSPSGRLLFDWQPVSEDGGFAAWVKQANEQEQPVTAVDCSNSCMQYLAAPLLAENRRAGVLLLGRSIAEVVLSFKEITGADMALVSKAHPGTRDEGLFLGAWDKQVVALTSAGRITPLLKEVSATHRIDALEQGMVIKHALGDFEVLAFPLVPATNGSVVEVLVVNDITLPLKEIKAAAKESLLIGLLGLLVSETLLLSILWTPMGRLIQVAQALPLLARNAFTDVRKQLEVRTLSSWGGDEIDLLGASAMDLSEQLETLERREKRHIAALRSQRDDLARETDFITGLMDTAEVVILTLDDKGLIRMLNQHGETTFGSAEIEIMGRSFFSLLLPEVVTPDLEQNMELLRSGQRERYRHESTIQTGNGELHTISWLHSRLAFHTDQDEVVLSVGLDITDRKKAESKLAWLADHDALTNLFNRRRFQTEFDHMLLMAQRYAHPGALLFIDLDHFKLINDTSGHQAGDAMLCMVAERMRKMVRATDLLVRLGGDEFALVLPETCREEATGVAEKLVKELEHLELPVRGLTHRISASVGIVMFPEHGESVRDLMAHADLAMYQAKDRGRSVWHMFSLDEGARERMDARVQWKRKIEKALEQDRFVLHFQPILNLQANAFSHFEVLVRMQDEDGALISPGAFIPVAEQTGLINNIDRVVLRKAVERMAELGAEGVYPVFSVNLSGRVVDDPELLPVLQQLLAKYRVDASRLVFELTETAAVADITAAEQMMVKLRELGCRFALDDFGVGFSSFYYLKQLPVDYVKIDGSFIRDLPNNTDDQLFVKALNEVALGLGKHTIAEFVEDAETLTLLKEFGVRYAQGFHIGKPTADIPPQFLLSASQIREISEPFHV
jgi:diguanylate cyclase (GGDEF)-like protein/PAS domain S-box-containing protein